VTRPLDPHARRLGITRKGTLADGGIDVRDPTADRRLIEFCLSVPTEQFFRNGVPRALARAALADRVPADPATSVSDGFSLRRFHFRPFPTGPAPRLAIIMTADLVLQSDPLPDQLLASDDQRPDSLRRQRLHMNGRDAPGHVRRCGRSCASPTTSTPYRLSTQTTGNPRWRKPW
jgi:hypothetical protein